MPKRGCLYQVKSYTLGSSQVGELLTKPDRSMLLTSGMEVVEIKLTWNWQWVSLRCGPGCICLSENLPLLKGLLVPDRRKLVLLPYPCLILTQGGIDLPKAAAYSRPFDGREIDFGEAEAGKCSCWWEEFWSLLYMIGTCLDPPVYGER